MLGRLCVILFCINGIICSKSKVYKLLDKTMEALDRTFDFILRYYKSMNVDGMYGVNTAQGHLTKALKDTTDSNLRRNLLLLKEKAQAIYALQSPNLKNFPYKYYVFNNYVIPPEVCMFDIEFSHGKLYPNSKVFTGPYNVSNLLDYIRYVLETTFSEDLSDNCLVDVATASKHRNPHNCPVSKPCYDYLIKMPKNYDSHFPGYGVTHTNFYYIIGCSSYYRIIYLQIARSRNCTFNKKELNYLVTQRCSYILWELKKNVQFGYIPQLFDLFLEQISVCGLEGFEEFLQNEYLEYILQEQNELGGFGITRISWKELVKKQRIKREANPMMGGANSHTTGLTSEVLALYIRFFIEKLSGSKIFYKN